MSGLKNGKINIEGSIFVSDLPPDPRGSKSLLKKRFLWERSGVPESQWWKHSAWRLELDDSCLLLQEVDVLKGLR